MGTETQKTQFSVLICLCICLFLTACAASVQSTVTPSLQVSIPTETQNPTQPPASTPTPTCMDNLTFVEDVTIPDFSIVTPGSSLDKQWRVQNSGSCNWDSHYRLRLVGGNPLGASTEQALFPARAGLQAILQVLFIAPMEPGEYLSEWQVFDAKGIPFGEMFFIKVIVQ
jgi:hypothetical protein